MGKFADCKVCGAKFQCSHKIRVIRQAYYYRRGKLQRLKHRAKALVRGLKYKYRSKYGLTLEQANELKNGNCDICGRHASLMHIDHKHGTKGTYRGVLCFPCNSRLGWFENNIEVIMAYIGPA